MVSCGMRIALLNPNTNRATTDVMTRIAQAALPDLMIEGWTATFGSDTITTPEALAVSAAAVSQMAGRVAADVGGVIGAACGDPGLEAIRNTLPCPVCGIGEASFLEAAAGGRRFAVVTTTPALVDAIAKGVTAAGFRDQFLGTHVTSGDPLALMRDAERLTNSLSAATAAAAASGAEAVIIGGGPLAQAAHELRALVPVPIIEPVPAAAKLIRRIIEARGNL